MAVKQYRPTTPARRGMSSQDFDTITTKKPVRSLIIAKKRGSGRNNQGKITTRHQGGGTKKYVRLVNFNLAKGIEASVEHIEYDPGRSARIARIKDQTGSYHYILAANGLKQGDKIASGDEASFKTAARMPLKSIPLGSTIHAVELTPGRGAQMVRSAGASAQLLAREGDWAQVKLPSGEVRRVSVECMASVGSVGNEQHQNVKWGKAGRNRYRGKRPSVHGKAMNPSDHPMGGGEGQTGPGRIPRTPWGKPALGLKTRHRKSTNKYIVRSRHAAKRKK